MACFTVCRICSGWLVQPLPDWNLSVWVWSAMLKLFLAQFKSFEEIAGISGFLHHLSILFLCAHCYIRKTNQVGYFTFTIPVENN
jgi:hypothetical protein